MTTDVNTVLKGLECCSKDDPECLDCPYEGQEFHCHELMQDTIVVIKNLLEKINNISDAESNSTNKFSKGDLADELNQSVLAADVKTEHEQD